MVQLIPMRRRKGFTMIELLVIVAIMAILAGFLVTYNSQSRQQVALLVERARIAQLIFKAKANAVSTYADPSSPCAFGVHFDYNARKYSLRTYTRASCNGMETATSLAGVTSAIWDKTEFTLDPSLNWAHTASDTVYDILFVPPEPRTLLANSVGNMLLVPGKVYLTTKAGTLQSVVSVNLYGQITF